MIKIAIIGGGPSGILSSIFLKKALKDSAEVFLYEKMDRIGKKLLATGNGKCNLSNVNLDSSLYNNIFAREIVDKYPPSVIQEELKNIGIFTHCDTSGRIYPITNSSNTVLDVLLNNLQKYCVNVKTNSLVKKIIKKNSRYQIITNNSSNEVDIVIVATGGKSSSFLGSNGEGYSLLKDLNVKITNLYPGLVGLKTNINDVKGLNGIRQKCLLSIIDKNKIVFQEQGEVQFKEDGISGIVVMNASRFLFRNFPNGYIELDLLPEINEQELVNFLKMHDLIGLLPKMLAKKIKEKSNNKQEIVKLIKHYSLFVNSDYGFERSQVTLGGVDLNEVKPNLELKKLDNIYIIGEILDIDGPCGGYNLHFAFACAMHITKCIIRKIK